MMRLLQPRSCVRHATAIVLLIGLLTLSSAAGAAPLGSTFTYQGQLKDGGQPATGLYDMQFCVFVDASDPTPLGCAADASDVPVENGLFTVALDFGGAMFSGQERYLEIRVRPGASTGSYMPLSPRQPIRAAPEALHAGAAAVATWSGLTGVPAGFADGIDNDSGGTVTSIVAGAGLTGGTITSSGTLSVDSTVQRRTVAPSCGAGQVIQAIAADGTPTCVSNSSNSTVAFANGYATTPAYGSFSAFISTTASVTVAANQNVHVTATAGLGASAIAGSGLNLFICYQASGGVPQEIGGGIFGLTIPANNRQMFTLSAILLNAAAGTYLVGLCGYTTTSPSPWTNNEYSYVSAFVL